MDVPNGNDRLIRTLQSLPLQELYRLSRSVATENTTALAAEDVTTKTARALPPSTVTLPSPSPGLTSTAVSTASPSFHSHRASATVDKVRETSTRGASSHGAGEETTWRGFHPEHDKASYSGSSVPSPLTGATGNTDEAAMASSPTPRRPSSPSPVSSSLSISEGSLVEIDMTMGSESTRLATPNSAHPSDARIRDGDAGDDVHRRLFDATTDSPTSVSSSSLSPQNEDDHQRDAPPSLLEAVHPTLTCGTTHLGTSHGDVENVLAVYGERLTRTEQQCADILEFLSFAEARRERLAEVFSGAVVTNSFLSASPLSPSSDETDLPGLQQGSSRMPHAQGLGLSDATSASLTEDSSIALRYAYLQNPHLRRRKLNRLGCHAPTSRDQTDREPLHFTRSAVHVALPLAGEEKKAEGVGNDDWSLRNTCPQRPTCQQRQWQQQQQQQPPQAEQCLVREEVPLRHHIMWAAEELDLYEDLVFGFTCSPSTRNQGS